MGNIKRVTPIGEFQTYDLEVDHPDHQFYLSNGILTSNSHSILYSMISYQTAYLKTHYPVEFLLANLMAEVKSNNPDASGNIEKIKKELRERKIKVVPPDINKSQLVYTIEGDDKLITGLDAIKFVGDEAIADILSKRPFKDFFDFMSRVNSKVVRANNIKALAACGALDSFKLSRKLMFFYCDDYRKKLKTWSKKHDFNKEIFEYPWPSNEEWTIQEKYALEQFYLGESFACKPAAAYNNFFKDDHSIITDLKVIKDKSNVHSFKGIVRDFFEFRVKKETSKYYGQPMAKLVLEDRIGDQITCTIFPDRWKIVQERIKQINKRAEFDTGLALHFSGNTNKYEDDIGIILETLFNISLPPSVPDDLKIKRKVNLRTSKVSNKSDTKILSSTDASSEDLFNEIEDILYDEGLIDLDEDDQDN